jgi:hypothetical protein
MNYMQIYKVYKMYDISCKTKAYVSKSSVIVIFTLNNVVQFRNI